MLFKCTLKVRKALRLRDEDLLHGDDALTGGFDHWFCNLFHVDRRKCVLFTHESTLFSVLAPGLLQADFRRFGEVFRTSASAVLKAEEGLSEEAMSLMFDDGPDTFCKTDSRAVLGSMNDHILTCKFHAAYAGGFENLDFIKMSGYLNHVPMGAIGMRNASERLKQILLNDRP